LSSLSAYCRQSRQPVPIGRRLSTYPPPPAPPTAARIHTRPTKPQLARAWRHPRTGVLQFRAALEDGPAASLNTALGARYTPMPARDGFSSAPGRRKPLRSRGAAVFENSTACAPIGCGLASRPQIDASRFVNADGTEPSAGRHLKQNLVDRIRLRPRVRPRPREMRDSSLK
jgi:hypothetical protein